jgi:hypothetical protein
VGAGERPVGFGQAGSDSRFRGPALLVGLREPGSGFLDAALIPTEYRQRDRAADDEGIAPEIVEASVAGDHLQVGNAFRPFEGERRLPL